MAEDADSTAGEDGHSVRRRRSSHHDSLTNAPDGAVSPSNHGQGSSTTARTPSHADATPHVRFSVDANRRPSLKKRKSDEHGNTDTLASPVQERQPPLGLVVNTHVAAGRHSASLTGQDLVESPSSVRTESGNPSSPLSPRSRSRGMSLRSSLFNRNMDRRFTHGDAVVELSDIRPSSAGNTRSAKKSDEPIVAVSPVVDRRDSPSPTPAFRPFSRKGNRMQAAIPALPNYQQWFQKHATHFLPITRARNAYERTRKFVLRIHEIPPSLDGRHVMLDPSRKLALVDERTNKPYVGNVIRSSKYTPYNFLPRQLFAQFSKLANFYFLCVSILQMIPGLSTTGTYTTIVPLLFFVSISMAKEGYEDFRRHKLDKAENNMLTQVLHAYRPFVASDGDGSHERQGPLHWASVKWHALRVGDVVKIQRDEPVPADIVLISSKGANNLAYIETMALDGETNLKNKQPPASLIPTFTSMEKIAAGGAEFVVEDPNLDLYRFEGKVTLNGKTAPLTNNEVVYRGSILRNTPEAIGIVIYSGEECKIRMNANKNPRIKAPSLQAIVNKIVFVIVIFVIMLSVFNTIAYNVWQGENEDKTWYLADGGVGFGPVLTSFIIMFNTMIPLSLYVSLEIVKVCQTLLLNDVDMYDEETNTPFEARTSTINEELGQVSYIFSDKTGTLTENVMRFRKMSVAGTAWLHDFDLKDPAEDGEMLWHKKRKPKGKGKKPLNAPSRISASNAVGENRGSGLPRKSTGALSGIVSSDADATSPAFGSSTAPWRPSTRYDEPSLQMSTRELIQYIQTQPRTAFASKARMMLLSMALCHTCLPERLDEASDKISFQASSPDELALVQAAQELGFLAYDRDVAVLTLKTYPNGINAEALYERYEILDVIEFSSKRKRMSVVVRFPDSRICVICKGADTIVMQKLRLASLARQKLAEVEKRVIERKSMEADRALRRRSSQIQRSSSIAGYARSSLQLGRTSLSRNSTGRLAPIRDEVDGWLRERERDVSPSPLDQTNYSPRPSGQLGRASMAPSEQRQNSLDPDEELVEEDMVNDEATVVERCFQHINDFATEGLRTLLYAYRFMEEDEYRHWKKIYSEATTSLKDRQQMIEKAGDVIEQRLELGGATAIEDKLQKGVPDTIDRLRRANIKMWMLTGDKRETAINIGGSCRLIKDYSAVTVLDWESGDVEQNIAAAILDIDHGSVAHSVVVVDGQTLAAIESHTAESDNALYTLFLDLAILADSVICCRASPSQKASLVNAIRRRVSRSVTLAIGDGANDIAMIQEAHVGIGITGKEGLQAARTSDYAIAQFRFLTKLLLVHGRWNYIRTCKYTVATFWKELLFYLTQALYQRSTGYSGTSLYESWSLTMFNTLFTSLPVIFLGVFEQDLRASTLIAAPELYTKGQRRAGFNLWVYIGWVCTAAAESVIIYYTMFGLYASAPQVMYNDMFSMGDLTFSVCIIVICTKFQITEQRYKSIMAAIAFVLSVGGWFLWNIILAGLYTKNNEYDVRGGFFNRFGRSGLWWMTLILAVAACLLFEIGLRATKAAFFPTDVEIFQALEQDLDVRKRFEEASASWLQAGWHRGSKKSSLELQREEEAQAKREGEVQALLDRPRVMEEGRSDLVSPAAGVAHRPPFVRIQTEEQQVMVEDGPRHSTDIQEMLSRRFGSVRQETLK